MGGPRGATERGGARMGEGERRVAVVGELRNDCSRSGMHDCSSFCGFDVRLSVCVCVCMFALCGSLVLSGESMSVSNKSE